MYFIWVENTKTEISRTTYEGEPITLNDYLKNVEFNIDDYETTCKYYTEDSLSIELKAEDKDGKVITYEIPLVLNENCSSTSSWVFSTCNLFILSLGMW